MVLSTINRIKTQKGCQPDAISCTCLTNIFSLKWRNTLQEILLCSTAVMALNLCQLYTPRPMLHLMWANDVQRVNLRFFSCTYLHFCTICDKDNFHLDFLKLCIIQKIFYYVVLTW